MICNEAEAYRNPYVDGELDVITAQRVEQHLSECSACARHYSDLQNLRREIASAHLEFTPPGGLERRIWVRVLPWRRRRALLPAIALALLLLLIPTWMLLRNTPSNNEIIDSHVRSLLAAHLVDVPSSDQHTVKPWFQGKVSFSPDVPDLSAHGFVLIGGRLEVLNGAPAAAIVYKAREHVINLFVSPAGTHDSSPSTSSQNGFQIVQWTKADLTYWAVSDVNAADLKTFVDLVSRQ